ncbi:MAG: hypothetical protein KAI66_20520, partial [Lentisphaeria bacterium]|nr:hypothetical protein [Lentisphaeria bacterium]
ELVEMNNPPKKKPITAPKTGIQEPVAPPAGKKPVGSPTQKMKLILSDRPLASATGGDGVYETTVCLYGRCSWQGGAPSALLDVRLFRDKSPNPVLTMPLLVPPADHTLDFSIPPRPRGWGEGLYSLRIMSGGQVLVETSFEIKTRKK